MKNQPTNSTNTLSRSIAHYVKNLASGERFRIFNGVTIVKLNNGDFYRLQLDGRPIDGTYATIMSEVRDIWS